VGRVMWGICLKKQIVESRNCETAIKPSHIAEKRMGKVGVLISLTGGRTDDE
jgi:hypothetical protein